MGSLERKEGEKMKNIKTFIIGFLSATCLFLIIGASSSHTHDAKSINYNWYEMGTTGTLQGQLQYIESRIGAFEEKIENLSK